jgi:hypothetical protein
MYAFMGIFSEFPRTKKCDFRRVSEVPLANSADEKKTPEKRQPNFGVFSTTNVAIMLY